MTVVATPKPSTKPNHPVHQDRMVARKITVERTPVPGTPVPMSPQNMANANFEIAPVISELTKINQPDSKLVSSRIAPNNTTTTKPTSTWLTPGKLTTKRLEQFVSTILPTSVQVQLDQPFGKDSLKHSFYAAKSFCHILLPLLKSGFLSCKATKALEKASFRARQLQQLRKKYVPIDFRSLQGFQKDWESTTTIRDNWKAMTSACALHYNGDIATVVRYIEGPHVNQHIDAKAVLEKLKPILTADVYDDVNRILTTGAPALCNAEATHQNFEAYL